MLEFGTSLPFYNIFSSSFRFLEFAPFWNTKQEYGRCWISLRGLLADTGPQVPHTAFCPLCTSHEGWPSLGLFSEVTRIPFPTHGKVAQQLGEFLAINSDSLASADFHLPGDYSGPSLDFCQSLTQVKVEVKDMRENSAVDR